MKKHISISDDFIELRPPPFEPYVFIVTSERMPSSIAMAAVTGASMKTIMLPVPTLPKHLQEVQERVRKHYRENEGNVPLFGRVLSYLFVYSPTEGILMDVDGNVIDEHKQGKFHPVSVSIQDRI